MLSFHSLALRYLNGLGLLGCVLWILLAIRNAILIDDPVCLVMVAIISRLLVCEVDEDED